MAVCVPRDHPWTSRQQILIAGVTCLVISVLAAGAVSQSPPRKANSDKTDSPAVKVAPAPTPDQARGKRLSGLQEPPFASYNNAEMPCHVLLSRPDRGCSHEPHGFSKARPCLASH